jgi:hypothetical protein
MAAKYKPVTSFNQLNLLSAVIMNKAQGKVEQTKATKSDEKCELRDT